VPTYRRPELLALALECWMPELAANAAEVELVVGDNDACERTQALVGAAAADVPVRYVRHETNLIYNGNVRRLLERHVRGEYVWICGDDDFVHPGALATILTALITRPDLDYLYVNTRFLPFEAGLPRDPREVDRSPQAVLANRDTTDRPLARVAEIVPLDPACFSGVYASIWRRQDALAAYTRDAPLVAFETLRGTFPHACHVAENFLGQPCYYFGTPLMTVSHQVSWRDYGPLFSLHWLPRLYDLLAAQGVPAAALAPHRRAQLRGAWKKLAYLRRNRDTPMGRPFSLRQFIASNWRFPEFWRIGPDAMLKNQFMRRLTGRR
jgi:glycosyltransferase involved in cell wall biosynthesis